MWELLGSVRMWIWMVFFLIAVYSLFELICNTVQHTLADENECEKRSRRVSSTPSSAEEKDEIFDLLPTASFFFGEPHVRKFPPLLSAYRGRHHLSRWPREHRWQDVQFPQSRSDAGSGWCRDHVRTFVWWIAGDRNTDRDSRGCSLSLLHRLVISC